MDTRVLTELEEFDELRDTWQDLCSAETSPFITFDWCREYARLVRREELFCVLVTDGGAIVGIAPLVRDGSTASGICDHLADHSKLWLGSEWIANTVVDALRDAGVRHLTGRAVHPAPIAMRLPCAVTPIPCPVLELEPGKAHGKRGLRSELRAKEHRLAETGPLVWTVDQMTTEVMERFLSLTDGWRSLTGRALLADGPGRRRFFERIAEVEPIAGKMMNATLWLDSSPVANELLLRVGDGIAYYVGAHHPALARYSPGLISLSRVIAWAAEAGYQFLDFLRGAAEFKTRFGAAPAYSVYDVSINLGGDRCS